MCETARTAPKANSFLLFIERMVRIHRHGKTEHFPIFVGRPKATPAIRKRFGNAPQDCLCLPKEGCFPTLRGRLPGRIYERPRTAPVVAARRPHRSPTARNLRFLLPGTPKRSRRVRSANGSETENRSRSRRGHRVTSFRKTRTYRNRSRTSDSGCSPQQRR